MKRVFSLILSLFMAFSIITGMDVSVFAASEYENHAKYLAELTFDGDYIHYDYLKRFQYDMPAASEYMVESTLGTKVEEAFETWDGICTIAQPSGLVENLTLQQQYETMIYSLVLETLSSESFVDFTYETALSNSVDFINLLSETTNGAQLYDKKDLTADDKLILKECANELTKGASSRWGALAEYTSIVGEIGDIVDSIIEIGVSAYEIVDRTSALLQLTDNQNYVVSYLERMKKTASNYSMVAAIDEVIKNIAGSTTIVVGDAVLDGAFSLGVVANKYAVDFLYGQLCVACPILGAVAFGLNAGVAISDLLFARSKEVEQYAHMKKFTELMTASRTALRYAENSCEVNVTYETAAEWIFGVDFVYNVYISNQNCAVEYYKTVSTNGLIQWVKSLFDSSMKESYEDYKNTVEKYNEYYTLTLNAFHSAWVCDFSEDFPETYVEYVNIRGGNYDVVITNVTQVDFMKSQYELAMNQTVKIPALAYPATAADAALTYSSSNTNVITVSSDGTITPVGEGTANVIATASNGVQGTCEITVYPYDVEVFYEGYKLTNYYFFNHEEIDIPSNINGVDVVAIGGDSDYAREKSMFDNNVTNIFGGTKVKKITIPDTVEWLDDYAFAGCKYIESLDIPNNVSFIGDRAFNGCTSLESISIPDGVTEIRESTFNNCSSLTEIAIPASVQVIEKRAFNGCDALSNVYITDLSNWCGIDFKLDLFSGFSSNPLSNNADLYLNNEKVVDLVIPPGIVYMNNVSFIGCKSIKTVTIPESIAYIRSNAFKKCSNLQGFDVVDTNPYFSSFEGVLFNKDKTEVIKYPESKSNITYSIPTNVTSIGSYAFEDCDNLTSIIIPDSVTSIGSFAFSGCSSLESVHITDIAAWCKINFESSSSNPLSYANNLYLNGELVADLFIPETITSIKEYAFYDADCIETVSVPNSVTTINSNAFSRCDSLISVTIPKSISTINSNAFSYCASLSDVALEVGVENIGANAFADCHALSNIQIPKTVVSIDDSAFTNSNDITIYCDYNSYGHNFAVDNNISYMLNTEDTNIDIINNVIYTDILGNRISNVVFGSEDFTYIMDTTYAGTGSAVDVMKDGEFHSQYILVVNGDTNGDSVCDALDAAQVALVTNGHQTIDGAYAMAADSNQDDEISIEDYQAIVNKAVS